MSHGLGQIFDGGAGSRCPAVFSTGYGAHQGKKTGVLGAHAFIVLGTVPIKSKDPGAQQYLVLGTVPIKGKKPGVLGAHAFFVLSTVPIKKKRLQVKPKANKLYKEALEQCNHNNHVSKFI